MNIPELHHENSDLFSKQIEALRTELLDTREQYEQERQLFETGPAIFFRWGISPTWPVEYVSPNIEEILGHKVDDLIGGELRFDTLIHPDDIERVSNVVHEFLQQPEGFFHVEYRLIDSNGHYHWLFSHAMVSDNQRDNPALLLVMCWILPREKRVKINSILLLQQWRVV